MAAVLARRRPGSPAGRILDRHRQTVHKITAGSLDMGAARHRSRHSRGIGSAPRTCRCDWRDRRHCASRETGRTRRGLVLVGLPAHGRRPARRATRHHDLVARAPAEADGAGMHGRCRPHGVRRWTDRHRWRRLRAGRPDAASPARALRERAGRGGVAIAADRWSPSAGSVHRGGAAGRRQRTGRADRDADRIRTAESTDGLRTRTGIRHVRAHAVAPSASRDRQEHGRAGAEHPPQAPASCWKPAG